MNINQLTASRIKELRTKSGLTAEAVANALNISQGAYSQMENGHVEITLTRIELLAQIFNVSIEDIVPTSTTVNQTYTHIKGGINGNNNNTHTLNNFFASHEEAFKALFESLKDSFEGKQS